MAEDRHGQGSSSSSNQDGKPVEGSRGGGRPGRPDVRPKTTTGTHRGRHTRSENTSGARRRQRDTRHDTRHDKTTTGDHSRSQHHPDNASALLQTLNSGIQPARHVPSSSSPRERRPTRPASRPLHHPRRLLASLQLPGDVCQSPAVVAVEIHLRDDLADFAAPENQILVKTAIRAFLARTGQFPKAAELLEDILDSEFREENILKNFVEWGEREFGAVDNVPAFRDFVGSLETSSSESCRSSSDDLPGTSTAAEPGGWETCTATSEQPTTRPLSNENIEQPSSVITYATSYNQAPGAETSRVSVSNDPDAETCLASQHEEPETEEFASPMTRSPDCLHTEIAPHAEVQPHNTEVQPHNTEVQPHNTEVQPHNTEIQPHNTEVQVQPVTKKSLEERLKRVLHRERDLLRLRAICSSCRLQPAEVTFLPCTHLITCTSCAAGCSLCPRCGEKVLAEAKTFLL